MTTIATASFIASYKTSVIYGRPTTVSEANQLEVFRANVLTAGRQCTTPVFDETTGTSQTYWSSSEDANSYAATVNAFSPAPTTACTVTAV